MTRDEVLASIAEYVGDDAAKVRDLVTGLRDKEGEHAPRLNAVAQKLINAGAGKKSGEVEGRVKELESLIASREDELEQSRADLEAARVKPTEQQAEWDKQRKRYEDAKAKAEKERDDERTARRADKVDLARAAFRQSLKGRVDDFGLEALNARFAARFRAKDDGSVEVLDEDGEPIEAPKGRTPEDVLADHAYEAVPAANRVRQANAGGGFGSNGTGPATLTEQQIDQQKRQQFRFTV